MVASSDTRIPERNRPALDGVRCSWDLQREFRENEGLATLGQLQALLANTVTKACWLDFQHVEWADPQPLLCLGLVLAESRLSKTEIVINLGNTANESSSTNHRIFLKFLAQQGFLTALAEYALLECDGVREDKIEDLRWRLATEPQATHFLNADCIFARIFECSRFASDQTSLQEEVEWLVKEAHERAIESAFGAVPLARDELFQKLRKLLFELVLNVAEHSHGEGETAYAGVYARIRGPSLPGDANATSWKNLFNRTLWTFGQGLFEPNRYAEWLELYVCDVGMGLTSRIGEWHAPAGPDGLAEDLKKAQSSKNPLESICSRLFRNPLSRHQRHDQNRTAVTGLQHLGHLLGIGGDYCRIYTQNGCWVGGHLPWTTNSYSRKDIRNPRTTPSYAGLSPVSGTAYVFSIQPKHNNVSDYNQYWVNSDEGSRSEIAAALAIRSGHLSTADALQPNQKGAVVYDRRTDRDCSPPSQTEPDLWQASTVVLRPPRLTSKLDIAKWLGLVAGTKSEKPISPVTSFVLADLTPFQTLIFRELLLNVEVHEEARLDFILVTEHWAVCALTKSKATSRFCEDKSKAQAFLQPSDLLYSVSDLAVSLREMDSKIFWQAKTASGEALPFFNAPVDWLVTNDKRERVMLQRYLDFPHALADPSRYRACRRALRRCLYLFPTYRAVPADDLVYSLVRDVTFSSYTGIADPRENKIVLVGSVTVTQQTVISAINSTDSVSIQMLVHGENSAPNPGASLSALLWMPSFGDLENAPDIDAEHTWRRIHHTPYIAPLGEQSISILRYKRDHEGRLDFKKGLYARTPEETYKDFEQLGILKTGHWKYGSRHDLLTINMRLAFRASFMELGPLYCWLKDQFSVLFKEKDNKPALAQLLIYPSHPVTDTMLDRIRQDSGFQDILPAGGMIPVKFLGIRTVSPLLASHLVAYRIEKALNGHKEWQEWSVAIIDDGVVTGKHMRELSQFLVALNAKKVYTIALLDRTGLPVQEKIVERFLDRNERFWRWDVPDLGNTRGCLLCQGLAIAQTYANKLQSKRQRTRLQGWMDIWAVQDVDTDWHFGGLKSTSFGTPLRVTFGVDESAEGRRNEKQILLNNSTAAASILLELTRLTTRADVTLGKAAGIGEIHPDAAIEILASQLLLFYDELSPRDRFDRYVRLLDLLWGRSVTSPAMSLAGLCFTLADREIIGDIFRYCALHLLRDRVLGNLDAILAANIVFSRHAFATGKPYQPAKDASETELNNCIMLGTDVTVYQCVCNFLIHLYRNPADPSHPSVHDTEIRKSLLKIRQSKLLNAQEVRSVLEELSLIEIVLTNLREGRIARLEEEEIAEFQKLVQSLRLALSEVAHDDVKSAAATLCDQLYGGSNRPGLVGRAAEQFLVVCKDEGQLDSDVISGIVRSIRQTWQKTISRKEVPQHSSESGYLWKDVGGEIIKPDIFLSRSGRITSLWLYWDSFVREALKDTFLNVYHVKHIEQQRESGNYDDGAEVNPKLSPVAIPDPWRRMSSNSRAHMWWQIHTEGQYAVFKVANASESRVIELRQTMNIAGLERIGGSIDITFEMISFETSFSELIAFATIKIPRHSFFIEELK